MAGDAKSGRAPLSAADTAHAAIDRFNAIALILAACAGRPQVVTKGEQHDVSSKRI
jgi:hypothetical protein